MWAGIFPLSADKIGWLQTEKNVEAKNRSRCLVEIAFIVRKNTFQGVSAKIEWNLCCTDLTEDLLYVLRRNGLVNMYIPVLGQESR